MSKHNFAISGQLSIFDILNPTPLKQTFSWDDDINIIHESIINLAEKFNLRTSGSKWEVWNHVPQFGFRMSVSLHMMQEQLVDEFWDELNEIVNYAKQKKIELSPMAPTFIRNDEEGWMHIFSMFLDRERQKIRK